MSIKVTLSDELIIISAEFMPFERSGARLSGDDVSLLRERLGKLARLARSQEHELSLHRLIEASGKISQEVAKVTAQASANLELMRDDNVVRPDFGAKKP